MIKPNPYSLRDEFNMEKKKIYFDMNIYNRPFDDQRQWRIRFETVACQMIFNIIQEKEADLVWSFMLEYENSLNPFSERREKTILLSQMAKHIIEPSAAIMNLSEILESEGLKNKDAVHLACAESFGCDFFITCDDKLVKKAGHIELIVKTANPVDFVSREVKNEI